MHRRSVLRAGGLAGLAGAFPMAGCAGGGNVTNGDTLVTESLLLPGAADELVALPASELSTAIRARQVSCVEVMQAYLARIEQHNPGVNAIVSMREPQALLDEAAQCDRELADGTSRGWMHGLPHAVKDLADATGLVTTHGSPIFKTNVADSDTIFVERIKAAGAIIIGKTNVPEFGLGSHTYNTVFGTTGNAWNHTKTAGGSSGGAATALALQMLPVADGSDFMGSLRNPAAFNNVIGFRTTPGLVPLSNSYIEEFPVNGPMGRNVQDTALLLSTMAGHHPSSPSSLPVDPSQFLGDLHRDWQGHRVGWLGDLGGYLPMEPEVLAVCESSLQGFRDVGCAVDEVSIDHSMPELWQTWLVFRHWLNRNKAMALYNKPALRELLKPEMIWEIEGGAALTAEDVGRASGERAAFYLALLKLFATHDFLVLPTAQVFPFAASMDWPKQVAGKTMDTYHRWMEVVIPGTLSGCPVINVPAGFNSAGLPMGMQIIGKRYADFALLQMAYAYEQATRWNLNQRPPALGS